MFRFFALYILTLNLMFRSAFSQKKLMILVKGTLKTLLFGMAFRFPKRIIRKKKVGDRQMGFTEVAISSDMFNRTIILKKKMNKALFCLLMISLMAIQSTCLTTTKSLSHQNLFGVDPVSGFRV